MLEVSLIICTRNRDHIIPDTLNAVASQTLDPAKYEVLIVDQSTNDKTQKLVEDYPHFRYIKLNSKGISISRNEGIRHSKGNVIIFVDDDIIFDENYLANIVDFFHNSELKPDVVGGKILFKYLGEKPEWLDGPLLGILGHSDYGEEPAIYDSHPKHVPFTGSIAIKRECLEKVGSFSTFISNIDSTIISNEDVIFSNKLRKLKYNLVYCPQMVVHHKIQPEHMTYQYYKNRYYSHGSSDAYLYYLLGTYSFKAIPWKVLRHTKRLVAGLILQHFKKKPQDKYYQKLRVYYNSGYLRTLLNILSRRGKFNENS